MIPESSMNPPIHRICGRHPRHQFSQLKAIIEGQPISGSIPDIDIWTYTSSLNRLNWWIGFGLRKDFVAQCSFAYARRMNETRKRDNRVKIVEALILKWFLRGNLANERIEMTVPYITVNIVVRWFAGSLNALRKLRIKFFDPNVT